MGKIVFIMGSPYKNGILHNCGKIDSLKTNQKRIVSLLSLEMQIAKEGR